DSCFTSWTGACSPAAGARVRDCTIAFACGGAGGNSGLSKADGRGRAARFRWTTANWSRRAARAPSERERRGGMGRPARRPLTMTAHVDPETARRVDELLAKISREGMGALSSEEQDFLKRSSEKYKK